MFIVSIPKEFTKADGKPFRKMAEDKDGKPVRVKDDEGNPLPATKDKEGNDVFQFETVPSSYLDMLSLFLNTIFDLVAAKAKDDVEAKVKEDDKTQPLKLQDSTSATDIFRAIHVAMDKKDKVFELEKTPHEWLEKMLTKYGVDFYGINAACMLEPIKKAEEQEATRAETRRESKRK